MLLMLRNSKILNGVRPKTAGFFSLRCKTTDNIFFSLFFLRLHFIVNNVHFIVNNVQNIPERIKVRVRVRLLKDDGGERRL